MATKKKAKKPTPSLMDLAAPVSERIEILEILLVDSKAKRTAARDHLPAKITLNVDTQTSVEKKAKIITVSARFAMSAEYEGAEDELLRIEARFDLRYRVPSFEGLLKANYDAFGEVNGVYNAWPYWREYVQSTTVRMGLPAPPVPVLRPQQIAALVKEAAVREKQPAGGRKKSG